MLSSQVRMRALSSVIAMRVVYAVNWLNIGAIYSVMNGTFGQDVAGLGALTASFYVGVGIFQVPGGIFAAKWGPKYAVVFGTTVASLGAVASGLSPQFVGVVAARFAVGAGMAFVFAPAVVLVARFLGRGREGLGIGLLNGTFDVGGAIGLFAWGDFAAAFGWRPSLLTSGILGVATGLVVMAMVPRDRPGKEFTVKLASLRAVLLDRKLGIISLGLLSISVGNGLIGSFMVFYLQQSFGLGYFVAGLVASLVVLIPIFAAPMAGRVFDRMKKPRLLMLLSAFGMAAALALAAGLGEGGAVLSSGMGGVFTGLGYTSAFAAARELNRSGAEYEGLAVAWVNCVSLFGSALPPVLFSYFVGVSGYFEAWMVAAGLTVLFALPLLALEEGVGVRAESR